MQAVENEPFSLRHYLKNTLIIFFAKCSGEPLISGGRIIILFEKCIDEPLIFAPEFRRPVSRSTENRVDFHVARRQVATVQ